MNDKKDDTAEITASGARLDIDKVESEKIETYECYSENTLLNNIIQLVDCLGNSMPKPGTRLKVVEKIEYCIEKLNEQKVEHDQRIRRIYELSGGQRDYATCNHPQNKLFRVPDDGDGAYCEDCGNRIKGRKNVPLRKNVKFKKINIDLGL